MCGTLRLRLGDVRRADLRRSIATRPCAILKKSSWPSTIPSSGWHRHGVRSSIFSRRRKDRVVCDVGQSRTSVWRFEQSWLCQRLENNKADVPDSRAT